MIGIDGSSGWGPGKKSDRGAGASATHQTLVCASPRSLSADRQRQRLARAGLSSRLGGLFVRHFVHRSIRSFVLGHISQALPPLAVSYHDHLLYVLTLPLLSHLPIFVCTSSLGHSFGVCPVSLIFATSALSCCSVYSLAAFVSSNVTAVQLPSSGSIPVLIALPCIYPRYQHAHLISLLRLDGTSDVIYIQAFTLAATPT